MHDLTLHILVILSNKLLFKTAIITYSYVILTRFNNVKNYQFYKDSNRIIMLNRLKEITLLALE